MNVGYFFIQIVALFFSALFVNTLYAQPCGQIVSYQCPHLNKGQSYSDDELIDLAGDAVSINTDDPAAWNMDLKLRDTRKLTRDVYLKATSPYYDQEIKRWNFTCYPPGSTAYSALKIIKVAYSKCFIDPVDKHFITCYLTTRCSN